MRIFFKMMSGNQQIEKSSETEKGTGLDRYPVILVKLVPSLLQSIQIMYPIKLKQVPDS